eukprot:TRINITY_DN1270_c0_g2_i1.p1 TRINITY_DN1270_c0_g2~~TRINITY_DN1270_c0_g2_i1.p1  ORF type:complete len:126 (-),score=7.82 TRINITY_DN1270_c0_g2_i1:36-413(-)
MECSAHFWFAIKEIKQDKKKDQSKESTPLSIPTRINLSSLLAEVWRVFRNVPFLALACACSFEGKWKCGARFWFGISFHILKKRMQDVQRFLEEKGLHRIRKYIVLGKGIVIKKKKKKKKKSTLR